MHIIDTLSYVCSLTKMMKLYQFEFFLFLLIIVNTTLSSSFPTLSQFAKPLEYIKKTTEAADYIWDKKIKKLVEDLKDKNLKNIKPSLPSQLPKYKGVDQIKQYLSDFGYLEQSGPFNNTLDQETVLALKTYQRYFNIQQDTLSEILQHIALPRCGVPDRILKYNLTNDISFPKGNQWFPKGTKNLTYGFDPRNKIPLDMTNVFRTALTQWSNTTRVLNFTETKSYDDANIKIGFYNITDDDGINDVAVGFTFIVLDSTNVKSGFITLDATKYWALPTEHRGFDLETAAMHQIGHLLGLEHSSDNKSIMYPTILPSHQKNVQITDSDNLAIQKLYSSSTKANANSDDSSGCFKLFGSSSSLLISLSIVFAFVALLN
ncbi:metalloendoproteinase 1 [Medicago truncatula]|nr:metalloendoproteinase 1 [Medicago truncatula]